MNTLIIVGDDDARCILYINVSRDEAVRRFKETRCIGHEPPVRVIENTDMIEGSHFEEAEE